jgi:hypothetical protein
MTKPALDRSRILRRAGRGLLSAAVALAVVLLASTSARPRAVLAAPAVSDDAATLMANVARIYADSTRGVLGVRSTSDLRIVAPVFRRDIRDAAWFVFDNGTLAQSSKAPDPRQPPLHDPYREAYLAEYRYALAPCTSCAPNEITIRFEGVAHDVAHAYGSLVVDRTTNRIVASSETPYKLPWPTRSGSLDATWGPVAGTWLPIGIRGEFVGRIGPFVGHAHYRQELSDYGRFATVGDAVRALDSAAPHVYIPKASGDGDADPAADSRAEVPAP